MKKHKVVLELEVYVEDGESPQKRADEVIRGINDYIGNGSNCDPPWVDGIRIVSVDKEPLPPTEEELEEQEVDERERVQVAEFLAKTALGTFVVVDHFFRGILTDVQHSDTVSIVDRRGVTRSWSRREGFLRHIMAEDPYCGHGRSRMDPEDCVECNRDARCLIEGIYKRDVM
jgi:hypothetical protein